MTTDPDWQRLDRRIVPAAAVRALLPLIPIAIGWLWLGQRELWSTLTFATLGLLVLAKPLGSVLSWIKLRYRLTGTDLEVTSGLMVRKEQRIPLERIRTVEIRSRAVERVFGIGMVAIGTGRHTGSDDELLLDGLATTVAGRLRRDLLAGQERRVVAPQTQPAPESPTIESPLIQVDPRWVGYHLLTAWTVMFPIAVVGLAYQGLPLLGATPDSWIGWYFSSFIPSVPIVVWLGCTVGIALGLGLLGSALAFMEGWWGYRLVREGTDTFVATRGLVTKRSITVERSRVRGVTLRTGPVSRMLHGARLSPILTGVSSRQEWSESAAILPTTQRRVANRVGDLLLEREVLSAEWVPRVGGRWTSHPPAAGRRLLTRYLVAWLLLPGALLATGAWLWDWSWWLAAPAAALPICGLAAHGAYRHLGHRLTPDLLWTRRGWLPRRTDVLELAGISSVAVRQSAFQRRLGLATVRVGTAAGEREYLVPDVDLGTARELATGLGGPTFERPTGALLPAAA